MSNVLGKLSLNTSPSQKRYSYELYRGSITKQLAVLSGGNRFNIESLDQLKQLSLQRKKIRSNLTAVFGNCLTLIMEALEPSTKVHTGILILIFTKTNTLFQCHFQEQSMRARGSSIKRLLQKISYMNYTEEHLQHSHFSVKFYVRLFTDVNLAPLLSHLAS